jgi:hypothetical protein
MKTQMLQNSFLAVTIAAALALAAGNVSAQDSSSAQTAPQLSYGVSQIIQLSKANISDDTIVTYVQNSGNNYGLDANQIVYMKQQGVSSKVINAMLNQHNLNTATQVASQPASSQDNSTATTAAQPTATYVQTAPAYAPSSSVYVMPDTQSYNYYSYAYPYYPYYGYYGYGWPAVSLSFGYYGGYRGGYYYGGYHGGYYGGWHGGGGYHGGGGWHH